MCRIIGLPIWVEEQVYDLVVMRFVFLPFLFAEGNVPWGMMRFVGGILDKL